MKKSYVYIFLISYFETAILSETLIYSVDKIERLTRQAEAVDDYRRELENIPSLQTEACYFRYWTIPSLSYSPSSKEF